MFPQLRFCATVEYDGTDFLGYQIQAQGRTVQGEIETALAKLAPSAVRIDGAGRTDSGVHATGQVIAFNLAWRHTENDLHRALNATLPHDIVVSKLTTTNRDFHPRFGAIRRTYRYQVDNRPWPGVLLRRYAFHVKQPLDVPAMNQAARQLVGRYDFASFGKPPQGNNSVRQLTQAEWVQHDEQEPLLLSFYITANAFLYRMVRNVVGTLVRVGLHQILEADVAHILSQKNLRLSAPPAPAHGLCLIKVTYPDRP